MNTNIDFLRWLSIKLYLITLGMYGTIGSIMILPQLVIHFISIPAPIARFVVFFIACFLRATYESLVIYEAPIKHLSLPKMLFLSLVTSGTLSLIAHFIQPSLGYFSIPVAIIISLVIVNRLKAALWPAHERTGFFAELPAKLDLNKFGMYGFYGFLVGIAYLAYGKYGFNFDYTFAAAFFVGMMFEEFYNLTNIYNQKIQIKTILSMIIWSAICAVAASSIVWGLIDMAGMQGQQATIISVITIKLIQPFGSRKFILKL